jgi:uncharacterized protein
VKPKVRYWQDAAGEWRYQLRAGNGEIIAHGEGHATKRDAQRAFERVAALAPDATPEDDPPPEAA